MCSERPDTFQIKVENADDPVPMRFAGAVLDNLSQIVGLLKNSAESQEALRQQNELILTNQQSILSLLHNLSKLKPNAAATCNDDDATFNIIQDLIQVKFTTKEQVEAFDDALKDVTVFKACVALFRTKLDKRPHVAVKQMLEEFLEAGIRDFFTAQGVNTKKDAFSKFSHIKNAILSTTSGKGTYPCVITEEDYLKGAALFFKMSANKTALLALEQPDAKRMRVDSRNESDV